MYLAEHYDDIILKDDILYVKLSGNTEFDTLFGNPLKMLVPLALRKEILQSAHSTKHTGHFKLQSTIYRISSRFHWRSMRSDIISFIDKCTPCSVTQDKIHMKNSIYTNMECSVLNSCVHMDLSGPWPKDNN